MNEEENKIPPPLPPIREGDISEKVDPRGVMKGGKPRRQRRKRQLTPDELKPPEPKKKKP